MQLMKMNGGPYLLCNTKGCCAGAKFEYVEEAVCELLRETLDGLKLMIRNGLEPETEAIEAALELAVRNSQK